MSQLVGKGLIHYENICCGAAHLKCLNEMLMHKSFERKIVNIFLPISFNISFGCSKEPSY